MGHIRHKALLRQFFSRLQGLLFFCSSSHSNAHIHLGVLEDHLEDVALLEDLRQDLRHRDHVLVRSVLHLAVQRKRPQQFLEENNGI